MNQLPPAPVQQQPPQAPQPPDPPRSGVATSYDRERGRIFSSPALWGETFLTDRNGEPRQYREYQREDLECRAAQVVHLDGRSVGKTVDLSTLVLWSALTRCGAQVLVAAPYQSQLDTIIGEVEWQLEQSELLRASVAKAVKGGLKIRRKPHYEIEWANGSRVYFRPAGCFGEAFRSLHVDCLFVDEAAWLPEAAWSALRQCLNADGVFRVYSTPNGLRNTAYYRITNSPEWRVFRWPSWIAPDWSGKRERDLLEFYGGKDSPGWQHEVAGEHGKPAYGAFGTVQVMRSLCEIPEYRKATVTGEALEGCDDEAQIRERLQAVLNLPGGHGVYWVGGDLGYTSDPCELLVLEETAAPAAGSGGTEPESAPGAVLRLVLRVHVEHVPYTAVTEILALIDRLYAPVGIGVDRGGNGMSVVHMLLDLDKYRDCRMAGRLVGYDFGGAVPVGEDANGKPINKPAKEQMTALINEALNSHRLRLPKADHEIEDQLCTQTYTLTERGHVVYSKGNDHVVDALRCALLRRAEERGEIFETSGGGVMVLDTWASARISRPLP